MKGKISDKLRAILSDRRAAAQLTEHLLHGRDGTVQLGNRSFRVHVESAPASETPRR